MPTYTTTSNLEDILPASLPATITTALKNQWIADASAMVDGQVGPRFPMLSTNQKFADITDSPATPAWIELCSRWLAAYFAFLKLKEVNKTEKLPSQAKTYFDQANKFLEQIRAGKLDVLDSAGADLAASAQIWSSTESRDASFNRGEYVDGTLEGDAGTLDDFALT